MGELIDRDDLLRNLKKDGFRFPEYFENIVLTQPVAYDVGMVVSRLRAASYLEENREVIGIRPAIAIIRNGGAK